MFFLFTFEVLFICSGRNARDVSVSSPEYLICRHDIVQHFFSTFIQDKRSSLNAHLGASGEEHLRKVWSKYLKTTERLSQYEKEMESMKERFDGNEEEINELLIEKVSTKERLSHLEGENCGQRKEMQTNTESMTKRLNELEEDSKSYKEWQNETRAMVERLNEELEIAKAQLVKLETEKEPMKKFQDQKVEEVISECRSSQKKFEEQNIALKEDVAKLQRQLEDAKSTATNDAQKLKRDIQAVYSEVQATRGKQPRNLASSFPFTPPVPLFSPYPLRAPLTESLTDPRPFTMSATRKPETASKEDKTRNSAELELVPIGYNKIVHPAVKRPKIEEATKCKYVLVKKGN